MSSATAHTVYPRYCFELSPTFTIWCLLRAVDIHGLDEHEDFKGQDFRFYKNLPIKWVRIVGVIVAIDTFKERRVFTVDDSSGACIEAVARNSKPTNPEDANAKQKPATKTGAGGANQKTLEEGKGIWLSATPSLTIPYCEIGVGTVVDVKGCLSQTSWGEAQIQIERMAAVPTTEQEVTLWERRDKFRREVLDQPWVLRSREIRERRKEAEKSEEQAERKRKRIQAMIDGQPSTKRRPDTEKTRGNTIRNKKASGAANATRLAELIQNGAKGQYSALGL